MKKRYFFIIIKLIFIFLSFIGYSQPQPRIKKITLDKGYKSRASVTSIKSDKEKNLWIVNFAGLVKYNGTDFTTINTNGVNKGTLLRFDENIDGEKFVVDHLGQVFFVQQDILKPFILNDSIKKVGSNREFVDISFDRNKTLHLSFSGLKGYITIDTTNTIKYPFDEKKATLQGIVCIVYEDRDPFFVFNTDSSLVSDSNYFYLVDEEFQVIDKYPIQYEIDNYFKFPYSIDKLSNGNFLFSSGKGQLIEFNKQSLVRSIPYDSPIKKVVIDSNQTIWISTANKIHYYEQEKLNIEDRKILNKEELASGSVVEASDFQGGLWLSSSKGLYQMQFPNHLYYNHKNTLKKEYNIFKVIALRDSSLIIGLDGEYLDLININNFKKDSLKLPPDFVNDRISSLHYDTLYNRFWAATRGKLICSSRNNNWFLKGKDLIGLRENSIIYLSENPTRDSTSIVGFFDNRFFFGKDTSIIYTSAPFQSRIRNVLVYGDSIFISTETGLFLELPDTLLNLKEQYPLLGNRVHSLSFFDNQIWLSIKNKGLFILKKDSLVPVTKIDGSNIYRASLVREHNNLWAITNGSIILFSPKKDKISGTSYSSSFFGPLPRFVTNDMKVGKSSFYWSATNDGILKTDFEDLKLNRVTKPHLIFNDIKINDVSYPTSDSVYSLAHDQNFIQIYYAGVNFSEHFVGYRFRITGFKDEWTYTKEDAMQFFGLAPGKYCFEVQARAGGPWSSSQSVCFIIRPPFWQNWWFLFSSGIIILICLYLLLTNRFKIKEREQSLIVERLHAEQKALRARMDPHFVFNIIASLQYMIQNNSNNKATYFLERFSSVMRSILDQTTNEYLSIKQEVHFLKEFLEMEQVRLENKFVFEIDCPSSVNQLNKIPSFLIQPFVENAIEHGIKNIDTSGELYLNFQVGANFLKVTIEDNGIGFNAAQKRNRSRKTYGISTVQERLKLLNKNKAKNAVIIEDLSSIDKNRKGTRVTLYIKLKK